MIKIDTLNKIERIKGLRLGSAIQNQLDISKKIQLNLSPIIQLNKIAMMNIAPYNLNIAKTLATIEAIKIPNIKIPTLELSFYHKSQVFLAMKSIEKIQTSINAVNNSSIQEIGRIVSVTHNSYINIHKVLEKNIISSIVPKNIGSLVQELINKESLTQKYLDTIEDNSIDITIEEPSLLAELEAIKSDVLESVDEGNQELNQAIEKLYAFVLAQKDPKIIIFFQQYLLPIILSLMASFIFKYLDTPKESILKSKNQRSTLKKQLTQSIKTYVPNFQNRKRYRLVTASVLNVREGKSIKTTAIGHLEFANIVEIIKKEKNWTLVKRYDADSETVIQGWVFTRYLAQIN